jgi:hypothetical protein
LLSESADAQTDVPVDELFLEARVSIFSNAFAKTPSGEASLANVLRDIRDGRHAERIATIRATFRRVLDKTGDSKEAKKAIAEQKRLLQAFCVSGTAMSRTQRDGHSGLLQIDLDELGESLADVREIMKRDRHIAFGFISPSGDGLKLGLRINGNLHIESFAAAKSYFKDHYGKQIDPAVKDRLRLCFVSHDPDLWENSDAVVFDTESYPVEAPLLSKKSSKLSLIRLHSTFCNTASLQPCTSAPLHNTADVVHGNIMAKKAAQEALEAKHPQLAKIYTDLVESRFQAISHARNNFITEAVPFLYRAVAPQLVLELVGCFYDCNRAIFNDSREQHMTEANAMLDSVEETYAGNLTTGERNVYNALTADEQNTFRICHDLAFLPEPERPSLTFFISYDHLAARLGIYSMQAQRVMQQLAGYGLLVQLTKGTPRAKGVRGEAGTYQWLLRDQQVVSSAEPQEVMI